MKNFKQIIKQLHTFLLLWSTQSFSSLGSSMTGFALILWSYEQHGSALLTSFLSICTYAPYVLLSIFAGTLSDKWNKKVTMLLCDGMAALTTIVVLYLLNTHQLQLWHLYVVNSVNGIMNALQQPASDVTITLLTPRELYQQVSSLRSFSDSLITVLVPVIASSLYAFLGLRAVIAFDLITFMTALFDPNTSLRINEE
ncbi:MFS transporter [Dielma fastidiosa]|uniref:MFS transporter n=1 Tax=Dielma fastidiosa TaxID=1034346 RepID=A0A318KIS1_9FIRM|nr:MFS transporter [Dielma fastidiosa]PXX77330.1 MFS transporter [Dielma fastidiosa]